MIGDGMQNNISRQEEEGISHTEREGKQQMFIKDCYLYKFRSIGIL